MSALYEKQPQNFIDELGENQFGEMVKKEIDKYLEANTVLIPNLAGVFSQTLLLLVNGLEICMN